MVFSNNLLAGSGGQSTGYEIENSLRFNYGDTPQFTRTIGSPTSTQKFTFSCWIKPCTFFNDTASRAIFSAATPGNSSSDRDIIGWTNDALLVAFNTGSWYEIKTTQVFRDPSSWYNIVVAMDTTQSTASNRTKIYINGSQVTDFSAAAYVSQNDTIAFCTDGKLHSINSYAYDTDSTNDRIDGYLADVNFIDGQQLGPDSFGETNSKTGQWIPIDTTGLTFGNNGFLLEFKDSSFIGKSTHQATGNEEMISQDAGTIIASTNTGFSTSISFDNLIDTNYPACNQWRVDAYVPDTGSFIGKDYGADNTIVATGFKVYPTGDYGFDTWTDASSAAVFSLQLQGSNDGTNYTNIGSATQINGASSATKISGLSNSTAYRYIRLLITSVSYGGSRNYFAVSEVEFFGVGTYFNAQGITTADQMTDTPTNNQATLNPLWAGATLSNGNLVATASGNAYQWATSTFEIDDGGKHVCEFQKSSGTFGYVGIFQIGNHSATSGNNYMYAYNLGTGEIVKNASIVTDLGTGADNSLMRIEYDGSNDTIEIFDDGTEIFPASTGVSNTVGLTGHNSLHFGCAPYASGTKITATFSPLSGTPTSGFKELTAANLSDPTIEDPSEYFQSVVYATTTSAQDITFGGNSDLAPDWLWFKGKSVASDHFLFDKVRGVLKPISSNDANAETTSAGSLTAFGSDGFSLGDGGSDNDINGASSSANFIAWGWAAGGTSGSSNSDGSVTSTVTVGSTQKFSIVKYTGTGSGNSTVGHGLGTTPSWIVLKHLDRGQNWRVFHTSEGVGETGFLNDTAAWAADPDRISAVSSTTFTAKSNMNESADYIAYCFAEVEGYSKFSSFVGNGNADGPFVNCGFKPAWVMTKNATSAGDSWPIADNVRSPFNVANATLLASLTVAETTGYQIDLLSNGFKARTTDHAVNESGATILYMAFAETPFKTATAR